MPVVAGRFYEGKAEILTKRIKDCFLKGLGPGRLPEGNPGTTRELKAIIAPHAGYMYSGMPAAHSFLRLYEDGKPDHIVIIGPNHYGVGARAAVCNDNWETPLGEVRYDTELGSAIVDENEHASNDCHQGTYLRVVRISWKDNRIYCKEDGYSCHCQLGFHTF
jgi:AmmeMemoRadiSam system protein B